MRSLFYVRRSGLRVKLEGAVWHLTRDRFRISVPSMGLQHFYLRMFSNQFDTLFNCSELQGNGNHLDLTRPIQFCGRQVLCSPVGVLEIATALKAYNKYSPLVAGQVVLDVGSYEGLYAIYAATKVGPTGRIIALEPDPANLRLLRENLIRSGVKNVEVIPSGLWKECCDVPMASNTSGSHISGIDIGEQATISVMTLELLLSQLGMPHVDFVKMDIEGAEVEVLESSLNILPSMSACWAVASYHLRDGQPTARLLEPIFNSAGYDVETDNFVHLTTYAMPKTN